MKMNSVAIHAKVSPWHKEYAPAYKKGLARHGIKAEITSSNERIADVSILFGPNSWKGIERDGKPYLVSNRKFVGFGRHVENTNAISWNGFNGRGKFCVDTIDKSRLLKTFDIDVNKMRQPVKGDKHLLCEQFDLGRCTKYNNINQWYDEIKKSFSPLKVRTKSNPEKIGHTAWEKQFCNEIEDIKEAHVLNSTVSVDLLYYGVPVKSWDEGDPCYAGTLENREKLFHYLAHCQWTKDEIANGDWWDQLKTNQGPRLNEIEL